MIFIILSIAALGFMGIPELNFNLSENQKIPS